MFKVVQKGMLSMNSMHKADRNTKLNETDTTDVTHYNLNYSSRQIQGQIQIEHIDLNYFKMQMCKIQGNHNHKQCPFYHNAKDRKRVSNFYSAEMCPYIENNQVCPYGENCNRAHNRVEQLYRQDNYKIKFCSYYPQNIYQCEYGKFCSFAHSEEDVVIELIHNLEYDDDFFMFYYKCHDKALCVYAHNWQDFRRKPQAYQYHPVACQNWKTSEFITEYNSGCCDSFNCTKCHGWKELEYHPMLFRTKQCLNLNCVKIDCSFYHTSNEKRQIDQLSQLRVFKIVPRNRIISNTFKVRDKQQQNITNTQSYHQNQSQELLDQKELKCNNNVNKHKILKVIPYPKKQFNKDANWLGTNQQNSSQFLDQDSDVEQKMLHNKQFQQSVLLPIQERTDSDELRDIMRKKSACQLEDKKPSEDVDNEHVMDVLKMIDMDG